jgi:hypothetical protein
MSDNPFWQVDMGKLLPTSGEFGRVRRHLAIAAQQLSELRRTPARVQLASELQELLAKNILK